MIEGIDVVFIHTSSPDLAAWYRETLGLTVTYDDGHWTEFKTTETSSRFALDFISDSPTPVEEQAVVISFKVMDINDVVNQLKQRGVSFYNPAQPIFDVGPSLIASFQDPEGNWLQLSQRKAQS